MSNSTDGDQSLEIARQLLEKTAETGRIDLDAPGVRYPATIDGKHVGPIQNDRCIPEKGHHSIPHKGCILR